jgi:peptidoglycan/LPS O-acetylase OafA/YrhL
MRRVLRIFPVYYAVLGLYMILFLAIARKSAEAPDSEVAFFQDLPYFATYTSNWFVARGRTFSHSWSLATEEQFYLFWPWVIGRSRRWFVPAALALLLILLKHASSYLMRIGWVTWSNLFVRMCACLAPAILLGCILAIFLHRRWFFPVLYHLLGQIWSAPLLFLALGISLFVTGIPTTVVLVLMTCVVGSCCIREDHWLRPVFTHSLIRYIGSISYGMYLIHVLAIRFAKNVFDDGDERPLLVFAAALVLSIVAAGISFRLYEQPFLRLKNRFRPDPLREDHAADEAVPSLRDPVQVTAS